jgi:hypothetical protein
MRQYELLGLTFERVPKDISGMREDLLRLTFKQVG